MTTFRVLLTGFGCWLKPNAALVERYKPGYAEIDREFTSPENKDFILHDSEGFEPGNVEAYNNVDRFIRERSNSTYLKDQLYAVWWEFPRGDFWLSLLLLGCVQRRQERAGV